MCTSATKTTPEIGCSCLLVTLGKSPKGYWEVNKWNIGPPSSQSDCSIHYKWILIMMYGIHPYYIMLQNLMYMYTRYKNISNEKRHYDSTEKERNKKNIRLADQLHFIGWKPITQKSYTGQGTLWIRWCQPTVFLVSFLFSRIIVMFFIGNLFVSCLDTFCFYVHIKVYISFLYRY